MLTIRDNRCDRNCQGLARRDFLRIGGLALGGLNLPGLLAARDQITAAGGEVRDKAVVLLFLQGGPSQIETFEPKMEAPAETRSVTGAVKTALPGVTFGGTFPKMARLADRLAVVRSYASLQGVHKYESVTTAGNGLKASWGAIYSHLAGTNRPTTGMPTNVLVLPEAVREGLKLKANYEFEELPALTKPGLLGGQHEAFNPVGGSELRASMELRLAPEQFDDRKRLLAGFDQLRREIDVEGRLERADKYRRQAFDIIFGGISRAFDLSREDPRTLERYDTSKLFRMEDWTKYVNLNRSTNLLGRQLLLARRLCEAGCGFVTVSDCGWDMHGDPSTIQTHDPGMVAMNPLGNQLDHAVAAFLEDVTERGLSERILLIITGEMGRGHTLTKCGGRGHNHLLTPLVFAGGGLKMGQVIGRSDRQASAAAGERYTPSHLMATIMHYLFDVGQLRLRASLAREIKTIIEDDRPISELF
jgi:hypothetical protein